MTSIVKTITAAVVAAGVMGASGLATASTAHALKFPLPTIKDIKDTLKCNGILNRCR
jgi:hypothetical protein